MTLLNVKMDATVENFVEAKVQLENLLNKVCQNMAECLDRREGLPEIHAESTRYITIKWIIKSKWMLIVLNRLERLLTGELLDAKPKAEWITIPEEIEKTFGDFKTKSGDFIAMEKEFFETQVAIIENMIKNENQLIGLMLHHTALPSGSRCAEVAAKVSNARVKLETAFKQFLETARNVNHLEAMISRLSF